MLPFLQRSNLLRRLSLSRTNGAISVFLSSIKCQHENDYSTTPSPDKKTTSLTVISNLKNLRHSPAPALAFGFSGLIPFCAAPAYMMLTQNFCPDVAFAQVAYGASIMSFLGGIKWGITLPPASGVAPNRRNLALSVTPSLIAWTGLLLPYPTSLLTVIAGLTVTAYWDLTTAGYPAWFKGLRFVLTFVAVLSLWTSFTLYLLIGPIGLPESQSSVVTEPTTKNTHSQSEQK